MAINVESVVDLEVPWTVRGNKLKLEEVSFVWVLDVSRTNL